MKGAGSYLRISETHDADLLAKYPFLPVLDETFKNGDGDYRGAKAERWRRIGRALFGARPHAPVMLHPSGMNIPFEEFRDQKWLDITSYQSGHGDDEATQRWLVTGPPAQVWQLDPPRPSINLEPPYENHIAYQSQQPISPFTTRRGMRMAGCCTRSS